MDYLVRDALHTGVTAGRFDYHRLLNTLTVIEHPVTGSPVLAIERGGLHAAEGLLLARYFMFLQVYFHDVRRIYDIHLKDFLVSQLPGGRFPAPLDSYLAWTDSQIHSDIAAVAGAGEEGGELASRLLHRQHYRAAWQVTAQDRSEDPEIFNELARHVQRIFGDGIRVDEAGKEAQTLEEGRLYILGDDGQPRDILRESALIQSLKPIWMGRVYAKQVLVPEVKETCAEFMRQEVANNNE